MKHSLRTQKNLRQYSFKEVLILKIWWRWVGEVSSAISFSYNRQFKKTIYFGKKIIFGGSLESP